MHHDDTRSNQPGNGEDAWIEDLLRRPARQAAGRREDAEAFTARVVSALPPPQDARTARARSDTSRAVAITIGAVLGSAAAWACGGEAVVESARTVVHLLGQVTANIHDPKAMMMDVFAGISVLVMLLLAGRGSVRRLFS